MLRLKRQAVLLSAALMLSGCLQNPQDELAKGISSARAAFEDQAPETNETIGNMELYVPGGYAIEEPSSEYEALITRKGEAFALFTNPNEAPDSTVFYDLQKANTESDWLVDEKFRQYGRFGFATVKKIAEERYELTVSSGGTKLSTITQEQALRQNMSWMMETVRSVESEKKE